MTKAIYIEKNSTAIEGCIKGNPQDQHTVYKLYSDAMYNVAVRIAKNEQDAQDILQDAFVEAFLKIKQYSREVAFGAWLKKIVVNKSLNFLRKHKNIVWECETALENLSEPEPNFNEERLSVERIKAGVLLLPEGYRLVLNLYLFEGYDHSEIAEILEISEVTSRTQFSRAKKKLCKILEEQ